MRLERPSEFHGLPITHKELDGEYGDEVADERPNDMLCFGQRGNARHVVGEVGGENGEGLGWQKCQYRVCNVDHRSKQWARRELSTGEQTLGETS